MLSVDDFERFFLAVHGVEPFPWQKRLLRHVVQTGKWPEVVDAPTGSGKTAAMDIALFHLALEAEQGNARRAPLRIALVVDRRLIVDDAHARAVRLQDALLSSAEGVVAQVAASLRRFTQADAPPLIARRLRGGLPRENDWARTPAQPTILCSTVDQVGSRLLFRGYGVSDAMKPVHAGLLGADCLILLDEAHLAEPFRQTLEWVRHYRDRQWRHTEYASPWGVSLLTATPGNRPVQPFKLNDDDYRHPVLGRRLHASKPGRLMLVKQPRSNEAADRTEDEETIDLSWRVKAIAGEIRKALQHFHDSDGTECRPAIGIVVNRVARARAVFEQLVQDFPDADVDLVIGPSRSAERDGRMVHLDLVRTGHSRELDKPFILVATQCIEAGVDIDLDALITELAPLDSLRQRFGRLNRAAREISPYASILAFTSDLSARSADRVYGPAVKAAWNLLESSATTVDGQLVVDFGVTAFNTPMDSAALATKQDAPVLLPAHLELLAQTSPVPAPDPDVGTYLHGTEREPDSIAVVWRADVQSHFGDETVRRLLLLVPPRSGEAIALPLWVVRRWLRSRNDSALKDLADTPSGEPDQPESRARGQFVFRWKGDDDGSRWASPSGIRPGDTIIVPANYGGVDQFGWNPQSHAPAADIAAKAARPFARQRFALRVAPGLIGDVTAEDLADMLSRAESRDVRTLKEALLTLSLPDDIRAELELLERAKGRVIPYLDVYPLTPQGRPSGIMFVAPLGLDVETDKPFGGEITATEDDNSGSAAGYAVRLESHCQHVSEIAARYAVMAGLEEDRQTDLRIAGALHDIGKADLRFQSWLYFGDPLGPDPAEGSSVLAKSARHLPIVARKHSGLPERWRHEALSVRLAPFVGEFNNARDPELVLWLIGTHHGHGRPLYPHHDPADAEERPLPSVCGLPPIISAGVGPQSLDYDLNGADWSALQLRLQGRYGIWELARMEAIVRLADHRASELERMEAANDPRFF